MYCTNRYFIACAFVAVCSAAPSHQSDSADATCANLDNQFDDFSAFNEEIVAPPGPTDATCSTSVNQKSAALLQIKKRVHVEPSNTPITAMDVNLTKEGYDLISGLCCAEEMVDFIERLIKSMGLQVCAEGGLPGLAIYHDCAKDDNNTYERLLDNIETAREGNCSWLQEDTHNCTNLTGKCPSFPNASLPPCIKDEEKTTTQLPTADEPPPPATPTKTNLPQPPKDDETPSICCKKKTSLLSTFVRSTRAKGASATSTVQEFDCAKYPGAIQVIKNETQGRYDVKDLDISTGTYKTLYSLPWSAVASLPKDANFAMNGVGINPIDSKAYGALKFSDDDAGYLIRFDEHKIEFLAELKDYTIVGSFSSKGDYYYQADNSLYVARQVADLDGFPSHIDNKDDLADFTDMDLRLLRKENWKKMADIVVYHGDLEGLGVESEYIIGLNINGNVYIAKDVEGTPHWKLPTAGSSEDLNYGAGWNFQGRVYFGGNSGSGVYEVPLAGLNINVDTSIMLKRVSDSERTKANDGMNCLEVESPFPPPTEGDCGTLYEEVPSNPDGHCPTDSFRA